MNQKINRTHQWLKWISLAIVFLIFIFAAAVPQALADDSKKKNPATVLIPASASVASASAAALPIVDNLFSAVALAAPED